MNQITGKLFKMVKSNCMSAVTVYSVIKFGKSFIKVCQIYAQVLTDASSVSLWEEEEAGSG